MSPSESSTLTLFVQCLKKVPDPRYDIKLCPDWERLHNHSAIHFALLKFTAYKCDL